MRLSFRSQRAHPVVECRLELTSDSEAILTTRLPVRAAASGQVKCYVNNFKPHFLFLELRFLRRQCLFGIGQNSGSFGNTLGSYC